MTAEPLRTVATNDGQNVSIHRLGEDDREALLSFGADLPKDDWLYLDVELQTPTTVSWLVNAVDARNWRQFVAVDGELIVGYANVRQLPGWKRHVGDIALVVRDGYRRHGVGRALASVIVESATEMGLKKLVVEVIKEQVGGQVIFKRFGFQQEGILVGHAVDYLGNHRDLVLLSFQLAEDTSS